MLLGSSALVKKWGQDLTIFWRVLSDFGVIQISALCLVSRMGFLPDSWGNPDTVQTSGAEDLAMGGRRAGLLGFYIYRKLRQVKDRERVGCVTARQILQCSALWASGKLG